MVDPKPSVYLFVGIERYLKDQAIDELRSSLVNGASKDVDYKVFYGGETNAKDILDYAATIPFSAPKRLVVIKDFEKLSREDRSALTAHIKVFPDTAALVLDTDDEAAAKEYHSMGRYIKILRFDTLTDVKMSGWIKGFLSSRGKSIEDNAVEILKELQGKNLLSLKQELEKLIAYVGESKVIKIEDVENAVGRSLIRSAFDIAWAIGEKKAKEAIELVHDLILAGKRPHEMVGLLSWHFKRILKAKVLQAKGETDYSIADILKIRRTESDKFFRQVKSCSLDRIRSRMGILLEADLDIKRSRFDPAMLLEFAIIRLCLT